jgi:hypothetical protein
MVKKELYSSKAYLKLEYHGGEAQADLVLFSYIMAFF